MSQENVEIVKRAWEAWHRDDLDANLVALHLEVELHTAIERNFEGTGSVFIGHDGFRKIASSRDFLSHAEGLKAAGLSE
jgi:hypothetical protein